MSVADYSKRQLKTIRFPTSQLKSTDLNRIHVTTLHLLQYTS